MNTVAMMLSLVGSCTCWIPGWGWIGIFLCALGCIIAVIGFTDKKTVPAALSMDVAALIYGGFGITFGAAFQIKHAAGELGYLLLPIEGNLSVVVAVVTYVLVWTAVLVGRKKARKAGMIGAFTALILFSTVGTTAFDYVDHEMIKTQSGSD